MMSFLEIYAILWVVLRMVPGFRVEALHTFLALQTSHGDWKRV